MLVSQTLSINLQQSTYTAFNNVSESYYEFDENWGSDIDFIRDAFSEKYPQLLSIIDLGCATGWHLISLAFLVKNVSELFGIDYSEKMITSAQRVVNRNELDDLFRFKQCSIEAADAVFQNKKFNVAICLNNTLGNLIEFDEKPSELYRLSILKSIKSILSKEGQFIVSVYNIDEFNPNTYSRYLTISHEMSDFTSGDIVIYHTYPDGEKHYCYSHWFSVNEIKNLLKTAGFVVEAIELRKKRILIRASLA